jgi:GcrA cell cycle regulator
MRLGERWRLSAVIRRNGASCLSARRMSKRGFRPASGPVPAVRKRGLIMSIATWTTERIEQLRHCVVTGLTCSEIAAEIGVSRNAVIGKIHRLGLSSGRPAGAQALGCPPRARRPRAPTQSRLLRLAYAQAPDGGEAIVFDTTVDSAQPCSLVELAERKCRWPLGDPVKPDFAFCGNEAVTGFTYCMGHARMAYRSGERRRA